MNAYTIQYKILNHTSVQTIFAYTANDAYMLGKAKTQMEVGDVSYSRSTWYSRFLSVVADPTCAYCAQPASRTCVDCLTLLCGRCGLPEPVCQECLAERLKTAEAQTSMFALT